MNKPVEWNLDLHQAHRVLQAINFATGQAEVFADQAQERGEKDQVASLSAMAILLAGDSVELKAAIKAYADPICQLPKEDAAKPEDLLIKDGRPPRAPRAKRTVRRG